MAGASQELVSYGGILLGRSTRALREWIERVVSPSDVYEFAYRTWPGSDRVAQPDISKGATSRVWEDITFRPFVPPRRIKLDTLYWPRDASRWAVGHFLASEKMVRLLRLKCYSGDEGKIAIRPQKLLINRCGDKLEPMLYMLPPRALSGITQTPQTNNLFLLTLVDQRYFWQFFDCGDGSGSGTETITTGWDQMLLRYAGMLPLSDLHSDSGPSDGFFSNKEEVSDKYQHPAHVLAEADSRPLPMLMDAAAYNMGKRLAFGLNGVLHAYTILESREILAKNLQTQKPRYAGHKFFFAVPRGTETGAVLPAAVKIAFPIFDIFNHWGGKWYKVTVDTTSISPYAKVNGIGTATFFETCPAYGDSPSNADELASLTREFAKDFLDHLYYANHDIT